MFSFKNSKTTLEKTFSKILSRCFIIACEKGLITVKNGEKSFLQICHVGYQKTQNFMLISEMSISFLGNAPIKSYEPPKLPEMRFYLKKSIFGNFGRP